MQGGKGKDELCDDRASIHEGKRASKPDVVEKVSIGTIFEDKCDMMWEGQDVAKVEEKWMAAEAMEDGAGGDKMRGPGWVGGRWDGEKLKDEMFSSVVVADVIQLCMRAGCQCME